MLNFHRLAALVLLAPLLPAARAQSLAIFLPENASYRYVNATSATSITVVPPEWYLESFDDSTWFQGTGAFGTSFGADLANAHGPGTPDAPQFPGGTEWGVNFDPYLRTTMTLPSAMPLTLWIAVDNGVQSISINGITSTISFNAEGQAFRWEHVVDIPASFVRPGDNLIALQIEDHGSATGFAMVITEDDPAAHPLFAVDPATPYCFGIGCPCANDDPAGGRMNSTGAGGRLSTAGSASAASDTLVMVMSHLPPHASTILYMGPNQVSVPFGNGLRCVSPGPPGMPPGTGFLRFAVASADAAGGLLYGPGLAAYAALNFGASGMISPGSTWNFQGYYRDPASSCITTFNLTNGVSVAFL